MRILPVLALAGFLGALLEPVAASAAIFRAYLSVNGNDANPCTLPQPCRLLPAALAAVNDGGEIWMLDSANFNTATVAIDKSVTILAVPGALGSIVANGGDALLVQGSATAEVTLRNLVILNLAGASNHGVNFAQGAQLTVEGCEISGLSIGIGITAAGSRVIVKETLVRNNVGIGIGFQGNLNAMLDRVDLVNTGTALAVAAGAQVQVRESSISGNGNGVLISNVAAAPVTSLLLSGTVVSGNGAGVQTGAGAVTQVSQVVLDDSVFTGNSVGVIHALAGVLNVFTRGNNTFRFNGSDGVGVFLQTLPPQ